MYNLLLEGGAQGHLNHLYDNNDLSFGEIKKVLSLAHHGKLKMVEKIDGFNIALSYRDGKGVVARNKGDLLNLGMDMNGLMNRDWKGGDKIKNIYMKALNSFEKSVKRLSPEEREEMFQGGTIFYNAELVGIDVNNLINYDKNVLSIHDGGHIIVNPETKEIKKVSLGELPNKLDKIIDKVEQASTGEDFHIMKTALATLEKQEDNSDVKIAIARLNKVISSKGLSDKNTIGDYLRVSLFPVIDKAIPEIQDNKKLKTIVANILIGEEKISNVFIDIPKEIRSKISQLKKVIPKILGKIIYPIEDIIHDFSVELLKGMRSSYIVDSGKEVERLRKEVENAIKAIQSSGNEDAIEILTKQLRKLKDIKNISTPSEGVVFQYKGNLYKFTGNFAPINQLLGIFKYGRGKIPPIQKENEIDEIETKNKVVAVYPGGFKPPHAGHFGVAKYISEIPGVNEVYVLISPKSRRGHSEDNEIEITADKSLQLWNLYTNKFPKIKAEIASSPSPVKSSYDFMETMKPGDTLVLTMGEKELESGEGKRFDRAQQWSDKNNLGVKVIIKATPMFSEGISGTNMRELIAKGKEVLFKKYLPKHLSNEEKNIAWNIVTNEKLEEMSIGASIQGVPFGFKKNKKDIKEMINREHFIEEIKLRNFVKEIIKTSYEKRKKELEKDKLEENFLRSFIKQILIETEVSDETPHQNTGINVLEDLLKKIIPIIEDDYKILTSDSEQRKSFRTHIINAVQNSLAPSMALEKENISNSEEITEQDEETKDDKVTMNVSSDDTEEEISDKEDIDNDEQFLDIGTKSKHEREKEMFTISGEDTTGRNMAMKSFDKIESNIIDAYGILSDEEDRSMFYDYLITNLKLYFDKFEEELKTSLPNVTTDEYEDEKDKQDLESPEETIDDEDEENLEEL